MLTTITELLSYGFMQKALIAGLAIALCCSLLGSFLVMRRLSLIGDGIAHLAFGGLAVGMLIGIQPVLVSLITAIAGSLWIQRVVQKLHLYGDAAIAVIMAFGMAVGVVVIGIVKGFTVNLFSFLFGTILALSTFDVILSVIVLFAVLLFLSIFHKQLLFMTFNEELASLQGINVTLVSTLLSMLAACTIIITIRAVGILLVSALLVIPTLIALQWSTSLKTTLTLAAASSVFAMLAGTFIAFFADVPVGGTVVLVLIAIFAGSVLFKGSRAAKAI